MQQIAVVGGGTMGAGIAEVGVLAGLDVTVVEAKDEFAEAFRTRFAASLDKRARRGKLTEEQVAGATARMQVTTELADVAGVPLVIEAVPEIEDLKLDLCRRLDAVLGPDAIIASNTSSIPLVKMASVTKRPAQVIGVHFFNPVPVLPLVEIVPSLLTSEDTVETVTRFVEDTLQKKTIRSRDRSGFIVNALLVPYLLSAIRMLESGFASAEDIDRGMVLGCAHPQGPLALTDLIGLDTTAAVAHSMYEEFKEPLYAAPPLLLRMVEAGLLGRKSGRGFYSYAD
jgi:3-hydroxybutyryl-CoA dehydrogenase